MFSLQFFLSRPIFFSPGVSIRGLTLVYPLDVPISYRLQYQYSYLLLHSLTEYGVLSLLANARLSIYQYNIISSYAIKENCLLYPKYENSAILITSSVITESSSSVVQDLVDHRLKMLSTSLS